ncbi:hypothetical protein Z517_08216 [Fonsecaea pedrosoi CBS 271.37]|uniref:Uncharacterized protein n=1 Tax=Fonsecaea pedrosoi CBS 271.37 TaxID=1442368 RepID=A0A0D2DL40_9EURO|nr:uncharacterized protein Z517_08216 [Fonsecaea pedrosoi CBS 271.37]KIW78381.1 hypothetical protein Z517_08216 [Fonsecaea pedrosoi CBS 271.37]
MSFKPISNWSGATSGDDGHLHVCPPKKSHNATPPHSSSNLSTRVSAGSEPSPEIRAEDSIASVATSQETQENKPRQRTSPIQGTPSNDPTSPQTSMTQARTSSEGDRRADWDSRRGSTMTDVSQQAREPSPPWQHPGSFSPSSPLLREVGSVMYSHPPECYGSFDSLEGEAHQLSGDREQEENISAPSHQEERPRPPSLG